MFAGEEVMDVDEDVARDTDEEVKRQGTMGQPFLNCQTHMVSFKSCSFSFSFDSAFSVMV